MFTGRTITANELKALSHDLVVDYHDDKMDEPYDDAGYCTCWLCQEIAPRIVAAANVIERLEAENAELRAAVAWESQRVDALHLAAANDEADMKDLRAENAALRAENNKLRFLNAVAEKAFDEGGATMDRASDEIERLLADNAALRARLDTCCEALMVDAEGR